MDIEPLNISVWDEYNGINDEKADRQRTHRNA